MANIYFTGSGSDRQAISVPADLLDASQLDGQSMSLPVAGAPSAKAQVFVLARRLGFEPLDAGGISTSRELESLAVLLIRINDAHGLHGRIAVHIGQPRQARVALDATGLR